MEIPSKIGKYKILKKLGEGASGCVLKAEQEEIQRIVALKILFSALLDAKPLLIKRFQREARLASSLVHPNIVPIFEIDEFKGMHYYTMQYIEGIPLVDYIKKDTLPLDVKINIFIELCDALALAHSRNIIHRDLKPHNVVITHELHPVILDFGIAKSLQEEEQMTQVGHILGSAHYMAPEQAGPGELSTATDVFGLGVMIYEMMTGERPFQGGNVKELLLKRIQYAQNPSLHRPHSMNELNPNIPSALDTIVFRCLEPEPKKRYQTAGELLESLQDFRRESALAQALADSHKQNMLPRPKVSLVYPFLMACFLFVSMSAVAFLVHTRQVDWGDGLRSFQKKGSEILQSTVQKIGQRWQRK